MWSFRNTMLVVAAFLGAGLLIALGKHYFSAGVIVVKQQSVRCCDAEAVAFSRDGRLLAVTCSRDLVSVYGFPQLNQVTELRAKEGRAFQTAFAPHTALLAVAEWADGVTFWDTTNWSKVREMRSLGRTNAVAWSPDGSWFASSIGANGWCVIVWKTNGHQEVYRFKSQGSSMFGPGFACVTFIDNQKLAAGGLDGCIYVWDLRNGHLLRRLCGHTQPIWRVAALPAEGLLASSSLDNTVVIWDWQRGKQVTVMSGLAVASCPSKGLLAISSGTKPVVLQLWEAQSARLIASQRVEGQNIMDMAFSGDGKYLVTVGNGESVIVWRIKSP